MELILGLLGIYHIMSQKKGEDIVELFNPDNIVNSAGGWDDEDLVSWLWEYVLDPNNIDAVITYDGAVVFNKNLIKQVSEEYLETIVEEENMNTGKDYIMEIQEEVRLPQGDSELVLEKGDRIQVVKEGVYSPEWINSIDFSNLIYTLQGMRIPVDSIMFTEESQYKDKYFAEVEPRFFSIKDLGVFSNALKSARLKIVGNVPRIGDSMWFDIVIEYTTKNQWA